MPPACQPSRYADTHLDTGQIALLCAQQAVHAIIHLARYTMAVLMTRWRTSTPFARPSSASIPVIRRHRAAMGAAGGESQFGWLRA
jgi:hypothetical protein